MSTLQILILCALGGTIVYWVGWLRGARHGENARWVDDFIDRAAKDRARRNRNGQFKATTPK